MSDHVTQPAPSDRKEEARAIKWFRANMTRDNLRTAGRIAIGVILSVIIAQAVGLKFAASTCIVTLLGIQATKRDTLRTAGQRIVSIAYTVAFALLANHLLGPTMGAFCVALIILCLFTYLIGWNGTLSVNVVVLVHLFLQQLPFTSGLILNELIRVFIGLVIALAINWRMPAKEEEFLADMALIEKTMEQMLQTFAAILRGRNVDSRKLEGQLKALETSLDNGMDNAYIFANNNLSDHAQYYMHYIALRKTEVFILYGVYKLIGDINVATDNDYFDLTADYMEALAHSIALEHPMDDTMAKKAQLDQALTDADLPATQHAFHNRAILLFILSSLEEMLKAKQDFIDELTDDLRERYWTDEHHF